MLSFCHCIGDLAELKAARASVLSRFLPEEEDADEEDEGEKQGQEQGDTAHTRASGSAAKASATARRSRRPGVGVLEPFPGVFT